MSPSLAGSITEDHDIGNRASNPEEIANSSSNDPPPCFSSQFDPAKASGSRVQIARSFFRPLSRKMRLASRVTTVE